MTITEAIEKLNTFYDKHQNETRLQIELVRNENDDVTNILFCRADDCFDTDEKRIVAEVDNTQECTMKINGIMPNKILQFVVVHLARTPLASRIDAFDLNLELSQYDLKHLASIKINLNAPANQGDKLPLTDDQLHALRHFRTAYHRAKEQQRQAHITA